MNIQPRLQTITCPCCGGFMGEAAPIEAVREAVTSPVKRSIFEELSRQPGQPVSRDVLRTATYAHRRGVAAENADHVLKVQVSQLRRCIEPYGWTISTNKGGSGNLAQWRLIPMEAGA